MNMGDNVLRAFIVGYFMFITSLLLPGKATGQAGGPESGTEVQTQAQQWTLVFEDRFEGTRLDTAKWRAVYGVPRDLDFRDQKAWHLPENIDVSDGKLNIIARRQAMDSMPVVTSWEPFKMKHEDFEYTTGEVWSTQKFHYGRFEARVKIPKGKGFWPAFWTFGGNPWNEIDIFEFWNEYDFRGNVDPGKLSRVHHMNLWFDNNNDGLGTPCSASYAGPDFSEDFHVFTMIWSPEHVSWYVDGELKRVVYQHYPFRGARPRCLYTEWDGEFFLNAFPQDPMSIVMNLAIQSDRNAPDETTPFPARMEVDWVRYYKRLQK
jgi:beta-glucanase (GH16 family)